MNIKISYSYINLIKVKRIYILTQIYLLPPAEKRILVHKSKGRQGQALMHPTLILCQD